MKMQLKLSGNYGKFLNPTTYTKVDNDKIVVEIVTNFGCNTNLYAKLNNGVEEKSILINNKKFEIYNDFLNVGECLIKIVAMVGDKRIGEYKCTPLLITELDDDKMIVDKIQEFEIKLNKLLEDFEEEKYNIKQELIRMQKSVKELIIAE